jgi:hypothetical protein
VTSVGVRVCEWVCVCVGVWVGVCVWVRRERDREGRREEQGGGACGGDNGKLERGGGVMFKGQQGGMEEGWVAERGSHGGGRVGRTLVGWV